MNTTVQSKPKKTKLIGIKEFRSNVTKYAELARAGKQRYVVTNHNKPLVELTPVTESIYSDEFIQSMERGIADIKAGRVKTLEEVMEELGISHD